MSKCKLCDKGHEPKVNGSSVEHWVVTGIRTARVAVKACREPDAAIARGQTLRALTLPPASDSEKLIESAYRQGIEAAAVFHDIQESAFTRLAKDYFREGNQDASAASLRTSVVHKSSALAIRALERTSNG